MLDPKKTYGLIRNCGVDFFTGVPDSLLKEFCACVSDLSEKGQHVIAANEGGSVALAAGHHLATGKCGLVYFQNSGLGNAVNPLLSLVDKNVYSVPLLLLIGWRGKPGVHDEPQHVSQGQATLPILDAMDVPYYVLTDDEGRSFKEIEEAHARAVRESRPVALVAPPNLFTVYDHLGGRNENDESLSLSREQAIAELIEQAGDDTMIVATTGKTSRELFELREGGRTKDFLSVGSMGHCSQIGLGIALAQPERKVICLDGDGAMLMHMGGMAIIGQSGARNFIHIIINNGAHESVGAQPTVAMALDIPTTAESLGYELTMKCSDLGDLQNCFKQALLASGPSLIEVRVRTGSRNDLGRPSSTPVENKISVMEHLQSGLPDK